MGMTVKQVVAPFVTDTSISIKHNLKRYDAYDSKHVTRYRDTEEASKERETVKAPHHLQTIKQEIKQKAMGMLEEI